MTVSIEALHLWRSVLRACPNPVAVCLMPNHVHVQHPRCLRLALAHGLSRHTSWLNQRHGRSGSMLLPLPEPHQTTGSRKQRRETRYIHLNPCRAGLVRDPLAWPWSSYRDALGLSLAPALRAVSDPQRLHAYTSADHSVSEHGTELPLAPAHFKLPSLFAAVSAVTRPPMPALHRRGEPRRLFVQSAKALSAASTTTIGEHVGLSPSAARAICATFDQRVRAVARVCADPRFPGLGQPS